MCYGTVPGSLRCVVVGFGPTFPASVPARFRPGPRPGSRRSAARLRPGPRPGSGQVRGPAPAALRPGSSQVRCPVPARSAARFRPGPRPGSGQVRGPAPAGLRPGGGRSVTRLRSACGQVPAGLRLGSCRSAARLRPVCGPAPAGLRPGSRRSAARLRLPCRVVPDGAFPSPGSRSAPGLRNGSRRGFPRGPPVGFDSVPGGLWLLHQVTGRFGEACGRAGLFPADLTQARGRVGPVPRAVRLRRVTPRSGRIYAIDCCATRYYPAALSSRADISRRE